MTESVCPSSRILDKDLVLILLQELGAIFMDYTVSSSRILRDHQNNSRGVGFARFALKPPLSDLD
jgi:hypothetical protein